MATTNYQMTKEAKIWSTVVLGAFSFWDTVTTIFGTLSILGKGGFQLILAGIFGVAITSLLVFTQPIMKNPHEDFFAYLFKGLWFLAIGYDLYTSWSGNDALITSGMGSNYIAQQAILVGITIIVSSSSLIISYIWWEVKTI